LGFSLGSVSHFSLLNTDSNPYITASGGPIRWVLPSKTLVSRINPSYSLSSSRVTSSSTGLKYFSVDSSLPTEIKTLAFISLNFIEASSSSLKITALSQSR